MKIIHLIEASATGTLSMASMLANRQQEEGYKVEIIYSKRSETPENLNLYFNKQIKLSRIQMITFPEKVKSIFKIRNLLKKEMPVTLIMHSSFAGFIGRIAGLNILKKSKFIYIPHCISFMRKDINAVKKMFFIIFELIASIKKSIYVACSESEKNIIEKFIPFSRCILIENAVKKSPIFPKTNIKEDMVVTVGQIRPQKSPKDFIEIFNLVKKDNPNINFIWVGDGDEVYKSKLTQAGINVTGWVSREKVLEYLTNSKIYLSTAKWEGMPVSIIEANYASIPVIASNCAGNIDVVDHKRTGWIYSNNNDAASYIKLAFKDYDIAKIYASHAFTKAINKYNEERYFREFNNLICGT